MKCKELPCHVGSGVVNGIFKSFPSLQEQALSLVDFWEQMSLKQSVIQVTDSIFINEKKKIWCLQNEELNCVELWQAPSSLNDHLSSFFKKMQKKKRSDRDFCWVLLLLVFCFFLKRCCVLIYVIKKKEFPNFLEPIKMYQKDHCIFFL